MTDAAPTPDIFRCPHCGKPTTEKLDTCRHCHAYLRGPKAGQKGNAIFADEGPAAKWGCLATLLLFVGIGAGGVTMCKQQAAESARIEAEQAAAEQKEEEDRYQERVRTGEVCADAVNNGNLALELNIKRGLKDPDSYEGISTTITPVGQGNQYDAVTRFRARNSLGGYVVGRAKARLYLAERNLCEVRIFKTID